PACDIQPWQSTTQPPDQRVPRCAPGRAKTQATPATLPQAARRSARRCRRCQVARNSATRSSRLIGVAQDLHRVPDSHFLAEFCQMRRKLRKATDITGDDSIGVDGEDGASLLFAKRGGDGGLVKVIRPRAAATKVCIG